MLRMSSLVFVVWVLASSLQAAYAGTIVALGVQDALLASNAAKAFKEKLAADTAADEKNVVSLEKQARDIQTKLQASKDLSTAEQLNQLQLQFQKVYQEFQRQGQALQRERAEREQQFLSEMRPKLDTVIRGLIEEQEISLIVNRQSTIYMEPGIDITPEVVKRLNAD